MQITLVPWKEFMTKISAAIQAQATPDKDLLVQAGFQKPPETWEELLLQAKKAQQIPRVYGLGQPVSNQTDSNIWEQVMRS